MPTLSSCTLDTAQTRRRWVLAGLTASATAALTACGVPIALPGKGRPASAAYERKAANHLYQRYASRIYRGKLPAMLYAVGVLEISLSGSGQIQRLNWMRKPSHAPKWCVKLNAWCVLPPPFHPPGWAV